MRPPAMFLALWLPLSAAHAEEGPKAYQCQDPASGDAMGFSIIEKAGSQDGTPCEIWMHPPNAPPVALQPISEAHAPFYCARDLEATIANYRGADWACEPTTLPTPAGSRIKG